MSAALGYPLLPWQAEFIEVATEHYARSGVPYRKAALCTVPRQSGKSILITAVAAHWLLTWPEQYAVLTAQTRIAATNRLKHLARRLSESGLDPEARFTRGVGNERIILSNGSQVDVVSPTAASVHGESVDLAIIDEAWKVDPIFLAGVVPAMVARPRSQLWVISTAGTEESQLLNDMTGRAQEDPQGDTAYVEYSMPDDAHPYDETRWGEWMPALGHTTTVDSIRAAKTVLSLPEFTRAFGNLPRMGDRAKAIPWEWWQTAEADLPPEVGLCLAVDVNRSPAGWSIAAAYPTPDGYHADLIEHSTGLELTPIPHRMRDLIQRFRPAAIGLDPFGPAGALTPDFEALARDYGVELHTFNGRQRAAADVYLFDLLRDHKHTHSRSIPLDTAVEGAHADSKGDTWFFSRPNSYVDLSPLLAVSMATWLAYATETLAPVVSIYGRG